MIDCQNLRHGVEEAVEEGEEDSLPTRRRCIALSKSNSPQGFGNQNYLRIVDGGCVECCRQGGLLYRYFMLPPGS